MEFVNLLKVASEYLPATATLLLSCGMAIFFIVGKRKDWNMADKKYLQSEIDRYQSEISMRLSEINGLRSENASLRTQIKTLRKEISNG